MEDVLKRQKANYDSSIVSSIDGIYLYDENKLKQLKADAPWMKNAKYFQKVKLSPSATIKMLMHANSGVESGIKKGGKPVEIMGMLVGRPDLEPNSLIISDVFALPIEGAETRVLADDHEVANYMIELGENLETTRKDRFMGWYHSHPFEVESFCHCFLSSTDLSTQLSWQQVEDPHGNPWLAIVIDPLRSLETGKPEFGAFRAYPPDWTGVANQTPDGRIILNDTERVERWGTCWNRYYCLKIEYCTNSLASSALSKLMNKFLWMRPFAYSKSVIESHNHVGDCVQQIAKQLNESSRQGKSRERIYAEKSNEVSARAFNEENLNSIEQTLELASTNFQILSTELVKSRLFDGIESDANEQDGDSMEVV